MEQEIRDFKGGLDQDTSPINYQAGKYFDCLNMRIVSDNNLTMGALENVKGNTLLTSIPETGAVAKITLDLPFDPLLVDPVDVTINGVTNTFPNGNLDQEVIFWQEFVDWFNASSFYPTYVAYMQSDGSAMYIVNTQGGQPMPFMIFASTGPGFVIDFSYIPPQSNLQIIGWVNLREDIYLLTTNNSTPNPGGVDPTLAADPQSAGQIWKLSYDKINKTFIAPTLIYNNYLNFTTLHCIPNPGGIESRYESQNIQRITWTDNFNKPRSINVADSNTFAITPASVDIVAQINHTTPISFYVSPSGGSLITGIHQIAYRLKNNGGGATSFSLPSAQIHITDRGEYLRYGADLYTDDSYQGASQGSQTGKSVQFQIKFLDTNYDRIEVVSIVREAINDTPVINIIYDYPIPPNGVFNFLYTGNEVGIPITLNEFTARAVDFKTVKTIAEKNNKLFYGNVKRVNFDIDFDARAYRFPLSAASTGATITTVKDKNGVTTNIDSSTWDTGFAYLAEDEDAIQDYNDQGPDDWTNFLYKPGTTDLGGQGPNVTYTFTQLPNATPVPLVDSLYYHILDTQDIGTSDAAGSSSRSPYRSTSSYNNVAWDFFVRNQLTFPIGTGYMDNHSPINSGLLRGYLRDEMYRFSLVFFDKLGNPGFAKWIADIRMPHTYMPDIASATSTDRTLQYPISSYDAASTTCFGYPMGIIFRIDFSSLSEADLNKISGFAIVRTKRTESDKHILGQGSVWPTLFGSGRIWLNVNSYPVLNPNYASWTYDKGVSMNSPEFLFGESPVLQTDDYVELITHYTDTQKDRFRDVAGGERDGKIITKTYTPTGVLNSITNAANNTPYVITDSHVFKPWNDSPYSYTDVSGTLVHNVSETNGNAGGDTLYLRSDAWESDFGNVTQFAALDGYVNNHNLYSGNYKRDIAKQYGGNTFVDRSNNEYIPCSPFVPLLDVNNPTFANLVVFGGDTFVTLFDNMRIFADYRETYINNSTGLRGTIFPVETSINTELRQADKISGESGEAVNTHYKYVLNKQSVPQSTATGIAWSEEYTYNPVYSAETDYIKFFTKPDPFIPNEEFDNRIYNSQVKINGELSDSWGIVKESDYLDVDGVCGPINNLITLINTLYFFQDKGVGKASVEERAAVATTSGDLTIGTGGTLTRFDYISRETGSKHQFGFTKNDSTVWFYDCIMKKLIQLNSQAQVALTDLKGLHSKLATLTGDIINTDNPYTNYGVSATYDYKNNEVIFTFKDTDQTFTISYNTLFQAFITRYSFTPGFYVSDKYNILSPNDTNTNLWIHDNGLYGNFYGSQYESILSILSNHLPIQTKILSNVEYLTEVFDANNVDQLTDTWNFIRFRNAKQNTDYQSIDTTISRRRERTWNIQVPRDRVLNTTQNSDIYTDLSPNRILHGKKMRDKYFITDLRYNNVNRLVMHYIKYLYSVSPR